MVLVATFVIPIFSQAQTGNSSDIAALRAQLEALLRQVAELQRKIAEQQGGQCYNFNVTLGFGSQGGEVAKIHAILRKIGAVIADDEINKQLFDESTAAAVVGFQATYRAEILVPIGLQNPTGVFGPATRKVFNRLYGCGGEFQSTPVVSPAPPKSEEPKAGDDDLLRRTRVIRIPETDVDLQATSQLKSGTVRISVFSMEGFNPKEERRLLTSPNFTVALYKRVCSEYGTGAYAAKGCVDYSEGDFVATQNTVGGVAEFRDIPVGFYMGRAEASGYEKSRFGFSATFSGKSPVAESGIGVVLLGAR